MGRGKPMNWQTETIDEINAGCVKCDPAWEEFHCPRCKGTGGYFPTDPQDDEECPDCGGCGTNPDNPAYLTVLDGRECMTEYGDLLMQRAIEKSEYYYASSLNLVLGINPMDGGSQEEAEIACATPRERLHAACDVLNPERNEE